MFMGSGPAFSPFALKGQTAGPDPALLDRRMEFSLEHMTVDPGADLIRTRLHERYGAFVEPQRLDPLDELVRKLYFPRTRTTGTGTQPARPFRAISKIWKRCSILFVWAAKYAGLRGPYVENVQW
jgi:hypothetical protein